jgi:cytochrome P450
MNALASLVRAMMRGDGNLLNLLPGSAYRMAMGPLGWSRRSTYIVNEPELVRQVLLDPEEIFPKSDLMVNALEPLIGDSIFVSSGDTWRRQRAMVDPALSMMRINRAFPAMEAGVEHCLAMLHEQTRAGGSFSLDLTMSHLTADIICRTVFSTGLELTAAHEVFDAFTLFERSVAQTEIMRLVLEKAWTKAPQKSEVLEACAVIRRHLGDLLDRKQAEAGTSFDDIAEALLLARDGQGGGFTREELIDQLGVLFLAGHETSASALTWAFYLVSRQPEVAKKIRAEVADVVGEGPISFEHTKKLSYTRNVFRETIRLYPPITFLPRVATRNTRLSTRHIRKGALIIVSPWVLHRHEKFWHEPDVFDPERFSAEREREIPANAYIPFGMGPRICSGAAFASIEAVLILASLLRSFDFFVHNPEKVTPAARLTTRPAEQIFITARAL